MSEDERRRRRAAKRRQTRRRRLLLAVLVVAVAAALAGIVVGLARGGSGPATSTLGAAAPPPSGDPVAGGTLTVSFEAAPQSLDPAVARDTESQSLERLLYQTLLTYASKPGVAGTALVPDLATEVPSRENGGVGSDGRVYTFRLDPDARFAPPVDKPVTAADVKWSIERVLRHPLSPAKALYAGIAGAQAYMDHTATSVSGLKVLDGNTLRITLGAPDAAFLTKVASPLASVLSKTWEAKVGADIERRPLGSGPYALKRWSSDQLDFVKNAGYAAPKGQDGPWADKVVAVFLPASEALARLQRGQVDVLGEGVTRKSLGAGSLKGSYVVNGPRLAGEYLFMNVHEAPFNAVNVRRAVSYAIDREHIQTVLDGDALALDQIYPAGLPGHQTDQHWYEYDPAKARALLKRAGYEDGLTTTLYTDGVDPQPALAEAIRRDLGAVGIRLTVRTMAPAVYWSFVSQAKSKATLVLANWYQDFPDPSDWIGPLFNEPVEGGNDFSFYRQRDVAKLYREAAAETDTPQRMRRFARMQEIVMRSAPVVPLTQPVFRGVCGEDVGGFYLHPVFTFDLGHYWKVDGT